MVHHCYQVGFLQKIDDGLGEDGLEDDGFGEAEHPEATTDHHEEAADSQTSNEFDQAESTSMQSEEAEDGQHAAAAAIVSNKEKQTRSPKRREKLKQDEGEAEEEQEKEKESRSGGPKERKGRIRLIPLWLRIPIVVALHGIDLLLADQLKVPVLIADEPMHCVAKGTGNAK